MALGAMAAIQEAGMRVPEDIAVMGFDGLAEGADAQPPLSTITQPVAELGREAVRMLLALVEEPDRAPGSDFLPTQLTLRRSCGCALTSSATEGGGVEGRDRSAPSPEASGTGLHRSRARSRAGDRAWLPRVAGYGAGSQRIQRGRRHDGYRTIEELARLFRSTTSIAAACLQTASALGLSATAAGAALSHFQPGGGARRAA